MATKTKTKTKSKKKSKPEVKSKKQRRLEREAKRKARKGDGSFPDVLVVTKEKAEKSGEKYFLGHGPELETLYKNDETVAVYKLRRVSTITINRKVAR